MRGLLARVMLLLTVGLAGCDWTEQPGPRLRRECMSLVDEVLKQHKNVPTHLLEAEFEKMPGVGPLPPLGVRPRFPTREDYPRGADHDFDSVFDDGSKPSSPQAKYLKEMKIYDAATTARDEKLSELMKAHPEVWNRLFQQRREKAINECIVTRAQKEGVVNP